MFKKIGVLIVTILGGLLLIYSASRSLDFIGLTLPEDKKPLAYFGLAALDGGVIAWLLSYMHGSKGGWQRAISMLMLIVDVIGSIVMFTMDTLYNTGKAGLTSAMNPEDIKTAVMGLSAVIALNIIASIAHHVTDPDAMREAAEEEAFAKVEEDTLKQITRNAATLAAQLAPILADDWTRQTQAKYMSYVGTGKRPDTLNLIARDIPPAMLPVANQQTTPLNIGALWRGLFNQNKNGRRYDFAVVGSPVAVGSPAVTVQTSQAATPAPVAVAVGSPAETAKTSEAQTSGIFTVGAAGS